jgi:hypothetical protein
MKKNGISSEMYAQTNGSVLSFFANRFFLHFSTPVKQERRWKFEPGVLHGIFPIYNVLIVLQSEKTFIKPYVFYIMDYKSRSLHILS